MADTLTDFAARPYWVFMLESVTSPDALRAALASDRTADYAKIFPRPALGAAMGVAAAHGREIVVATAIACADDGRQRDHMKKAVNRLSFLSPAVRRTVDANLCHGDSTALLAHLAPIARDATVISGDRDFLDRAHAMGMKTIWLDENPVGTPAGDSPHYRVRIAEWLMFFMARSLEKSSKNMKPGAPVPG